MSSLRLLPPATSLRGSIRLSGSKSLSNRLLILNAVSGSPLSLTNLSDAEDSVLLQKALGLIQHSEKATIDVRHAGTDLRFLCAFLSTTEGEWVLTGSQRLCERPISGLVMALQSLGADIQYAAKPGFPPLKIKGKKLKGAKVQLPADISSQFVSALMLSAPRFETGLDIELAGKTVSFSYVLMSAELLRVFGYTVLIGKQNISVQTSTSKPALKGTFKVESDWSSASYYYSLCALSPGSILELEGLQKPSLQADSVALDLFEKLGVKSRFAGDRLQLENTNLYEKEFEYNFNDCPDLAPTIACTCLGLGIRARLFGLETLQIKESRRIDALKHELTKFGAEVETGNNYLFLSPSNRTSAIIPEIETYQDHRIAMAFAPLSIKHPGLLIREPDVVAKSYPGFWRDLQSLGFSLNLQT